MVRAVAWADSRTLTGVGHGINIAGPIRVIDVFLDFPDGELDTVNIAGQGHESDLGCTGYTRTSRA